MSQRDLLGKILNGSADPRAVLFYGADQSQMDELATEIVSFWVGVEAEALGRHVDFQKIEPFGAGKIIRKDTIMPIKTGDEEGSFKGIPAVEFFRTRPLMGKHKAMWFLGADRFGPDAANSFLKTLEELPPHARVVLTTTQFSRVLPTIRSRCLCVACGRDEWRGGAPANEMEVVWGQNSGDLGRIREFSGVFGELWELLELVPTAPMVAAVMFSERATGLAADYAKLVGIGTRDAQVILLELIGRWWLVRYPERPEVGTLCSSIAREILGYANGQLGYDVLFGTMLEQIREPMEMGGR